ncbi:MAG TPA: hypothetical protein VMT52_08100 [Planctomycetota bacterium]|nr:hypothetical protein [Planctomycetota bacterium]
MGGISRDAVACSVEASREARRAPLSTLLALALLVGLVPCVGSGCKTREIDPERTFERGPLPYHVGIYLDLDSFQFPARPVVDSPPDTDDAARAAASEESMPPAARIAFALAPEEFLEGVAAALVKDPTSASQVKVLAATSRAQALEEASGLDVLLAVGLEARPEFDEHDWLWGWAGIEVVSWLFGGIPAWFVPTVDYVTEGRLVVDGLDLHSRAGSDVSPFDWKETLESPRQNVSLWDRSHPLDRPIDYLATLLIPPMFLLPGDPDRLSLEIANDMTRDLGEKLVVSLRGHLLEAEPRRALSVAFVSPDPLASIEGETILLRLGIASRDEGLAGDTGPGAGARIRAMDVHRLSSGAEPFRWTMSRGAMEGLSRDLEVAAKESGAAGSRYTLLDVTEPIPLEKGQNTIKVRILREDGERVTRTMVYFR